MAFHVDTLYQSLQKSVVKLEISPLRTEINLNCI